MGTETYTVMMPRELTAENGAKLLLSGEFFESVQIPCEDCERFSAGDCEYCEGKGTITQKVPVSWTTIKAIYAKAVAGLGV